MLGDHGRTMRQTLLGIKSFGAVIAVLLVVLIAGWETASNALQVMESGPRATAGG
jgi:hypothetical protein